MEQHRGETWHRVDGKGTEGTGKDNPDMEQHRGEARCRLGGWNCQSSAGFYRGPPELDFLWEMWGSPLANRLFFAESDSEPEGQRTITPSPRSKSR